MHCVTGANDFWFPLKLHSATIDNQFRRSATVRNGSTISMRLSRLPSRFRDRSDAMSVRCLLHSRTETR